MGRKIVQVAVIQMPDSYDDAVAQVVALADDGTLWIGDASTYKARWARIDDLPQDAEVTP